MWHPIETAPKDRKIDLWAKVWLAHNDTFISERFPDCRWMNGDSMCNVDPYWMGLPKEWRATHWMEPPGPPGPPPSSANE